MPGRPDPRLGSCAHQLCDTEQSLHLCEPHVLRGTFFFFFFNSTNIARLSQLGAGGRKGESARLAIWSSQSRCGRQTPSHHGDLCIVLCVFRMNYVYT